MECMLWSLQYIGYSEYGVYAGGVCSTLDTVNPVYCGVHSEYRVYAGGVYSTLQ